jgi:4-aminobutyrate aminotransferase-like enzyme
MTLGDLTPAMRVRPPGPGSADRSRRLRVAESQNVTFLSDTFPVFWSEAQGTNVRDVDGNIYVDLTGAFGVSVAGHAHPAIVEAIRMQAGTLVHGMGDVHPPAIKVELLERLCALSPWTDAKGILASTGSEAVEIALKTALLATGHPGVIAFQGGYHGLTLGALSTTARSYFREPFREWLPDSVSFVPFPDPHLAPEEESTRCLRALDRVLRASAEAGVPVGAVVIEPIQGRAGVRVPPPRFLAGVAERARQAGALVIFDEIFTGLGRTGSLFAFESENITPDVLCLGKALGGGLPLSCCIASAGVMDAWPPSPGEALHTSTFLGHPLSCAASLALLGVLEEEGLVERAGTEGSRLIGLLTEALADSVPSAQVRGRGLFIGIDLGSEPPHPPSGSAAAAAAALLHDGIMVLPAGEAGAVIEITPPFTISRPQVDWCVEAIVSRLSSLQAG